MSARPEKGSRFGWALTAFGIACLGGAVFFLEAGLRAEGGDDVIVEVEHAIAPITASTVPPARLVDAGDQDAADTAAGADSSTGSATAAESVEVRDSDVPDEVIAPRSPPVGLWIDTIDVSRFPVRPVGLENDGQLEIPDETEIGWYKYGATAGAPGATVLAAHVNWRGSLGPFAQLGSMEPGDQIEVTLQDGTTRDYSVTERTMYGKLELPRERIWRNTGPEELVLITCGGDYNPDIRRYKHNIVVYAAPVG